MSRAELLRDLLAASEAVRQLVSGRISMQDFIGLYDDYYHAAALDGHENSPELGEFIKAEQPLVALHADVQRILDKSYTGPGVVAYEAAGRIDLQEAQRRIEQTARDHNLSRLVEELRAQVAEHQ